MEITDDLPHTGHTIGSIFNAWYLLDLIGYRRPGAVCHGGQEVLGLSLINDKPVKLLPWEASNLIIGRKGRRIEKRCPLSLMSM